MDDFVNDFHNMRYRIAEVLEIVRTNRDEHTEIFEEAVIAYRKESERQLERRLDDIRMGRNFTLVFKMPVPENHVADFDAAIKMLEMSEAAGEEFVVLGKSTFQQLIMNEWGWMDSWHQNTVAYTESV